jgi:glycosyltransferase involved in cell wall biosynthesis
VGKRGVVLNGKFLVAEPSGVHRVAEELITHLDALLAEGAGGDRTWELVCPPDAKRTLPLKVIATTRRGRLTWQPWEQFELPWLARGRLLVNLCNLAPITGPREIAMIHDAQVFISPESYSKAFRAWYQFALPRIGARSARVLTVSDYSREQLVAYGVAKRQKIEVIHNGVDHLSDISPDPACLARLGLAANGYVVALANTQKHKNVALVLQAFARPELANVKLVLVGGHGAQDFARLGLTPTPNVLFPGRVSDGELRALYQSATCLVFPSTTEGFGLPPLEAMLAGCAAVVAPCGALPEVCGEAAVYVAPDDAAGVAAAVLRLGANDTERQALIDKGRIQAAQFTWKRSARRLLDIILEEADRSGA